MRDLNRRFRRKNEPTDVLSFPAIVVGFAGDIAISGEIAKSNGRELGHGTATELKILILHGMLHLAGFDHEEDDGEMERKERRLRSALGLPEGLIERNSSARAPSRKQASSRRATAVKRTVRVRRRKQ
jgi:probable rRNA maturation factor